MLCGVLFHLLQRRATKRKSKKAGKNVYSPRKAQLEAEREMDNEDDAGGYGPLLLTLPNMLFQC